MTLHYVAYIKIMCYGTDVFVLLVHCHVRWLLYDFLKKISHTNLRNYIFMELMIKTAELSIKTSELILIPRYLKLKPRN